jgi:hypothetical protein
MHPNNKRSLAQMAASFSCGCMYRGQVLKKILINDVIAFKIVQNFLKDHQSRSPKILF